jgi:hypothetical protein
MAGNISNWSIFIGGDASGGVEALRMTATEADITGKHIAEVGKSAAQSKAGFEAMADGIRRVAQQQELLDARKMKSQESSGRGRRGLDPMAAAMAPFSHERLVGGTSEPGAEVRLQDELTRSIVKGQAERTAAVAAGAANRFNISNQELIRERELAQLRADMITRSAQAEIAAITERNSRITAAAALRDRLQQTQNVLQTVRDVQTRPAREEAAQLASERAADAERRAAWVQRATERQREQDMIRATATTNAAAQAAILQQELQIERAADAERRAAWVQRATERQREQDMIRATATANAAVQAAILQQELQIERAADAERRAAWAQRATERQREQDMIRATATANAAAQAAILQQELQAEQDYYARRDRARELDQKRQYDDFVKQEAIIEASLARQRTLREEADADRATRLQSRMAGAQNADTRNPMQDMEDSIARMRGELNPMVGMQHRLAREAMEFRQQLDLAVISGRMNWQTAQGILNTYEQVSAELQQHVQLQNQGFLGSRRAGFAAQQFGYAIEDAASVYGTMGLAGAFRAAGNNLTVMAAQVNPMVGTIASISSAVIALGINFYNAKKNAEELKKAVEDVAEARNKFASQYQDEIALQQELSSARAAGVDSLRQMYESLGSSIARLTEQIEVNAQVQAQTAAIEAAIKRVEELNKLAAERSSTWWSDNFRTVIMGWEYIRDAAKGTFAQIDDLVTHLSATLSEVFDGISMSFTGDFSGAAEKIRGASAAGNRAIAEKRKLEQDQQNAANAMENQIHLQEKALKDLLDPEKQRLKLMEEQLRSGEDRLALEEKARNNPLNMNPATKGVAQGEYDPRRPETWTMRAQLGAGADREKRQQIGIGGISAIDEFDWQQKWLEKKIRESRAFASDPKRSDAIREGQMAKAIEMQDELNRLIQMENDIRAAGQEDFLKANRSIMSRYESMNEELRIENEIVRAHEQLNQELDAAVASGRITRDQATELKNEFIDITNAEEERRNNEKEIAKLQKREGTLEGLARESLSPATVVAGLSKGSDEARAFLENERLRSMAQKDAEPQIKELREVRAEIKRLRESNEKIGQSAPAVATLF